MGKEVFMNSKSYSYIIVGGGLAGVSAIKGIRELDQKGSILLISAEEHLPYDRPPLSKKLWLGAEKLEDISLHSSEYYEKNGVHLLLGHSVVSLDRNEKSLTVADKENYRYEKLLLAMGGTPRKMSIPGGDLKGLYHYRYLNDYLSLAKEVAANKRALVIGGGFIGSEMAAALATHHLAVTLLFPEEYICKRVFPESLGAAIGKKFGERGIEVRSGDLPVSIEKNGPVYKTHTKKGNIIESDLIVVGIGLLPSDGLAKEAGLKTDNGIIVDDQLRTLDGSIYAAGDIARFPYSTFHRLARIEHQDNALRQGHLAGRNMAGATESYTHMPFFYSDLFEFGYEAVGDVNSELEIIADWQVENETGVICYLKDDRVQGVMLCNVWESVEKARELIRSGRKIQKGDLNELFQFKSSDAHV